MAPAASTHSATPMRARRWDIFCRVIDNFGDIGVCWRLASQLADGGDAVRLIVDDASALAWMAPERERTTPGVSVLPWPGAAANDDVADIVIEAFGCDPPAAYAQAMRRRKPVWINLEYLSAEGYVERSHGLASPRADGLRKWFFYPGFSARTGGLLREPGLPARQRAFDGQRWLAGLGPEFVPRPGERVVSLFCYRNPMLGELLASLAQQPTLVLLTPGPAQKQVHALGALPGLPGLPGHLRIAALPWLSQMDFDHLLWASDLNCVRGEDSLVRALWAGKPWLWQAYPQDDGAHAAKVQALIECMAWPAEVAAVWRAWNGVANWLAPLPAVGPWQAAAQAARAQLVVHDDLVTQLRRFVTERVARTP